jgi:uncharacterized LabA/DUF88 family protein
MKIEIEIDNPSLFTQEEKYHVEKALLFIGYIHSNKKLYEALALYGYTLIFRPTVKDAQGKSKGNVDAELVLHAAAIEFRNYNKAIVVSGDGDFQCLVSFLVEKKKLLKIIVPNRRFSSLLRTYSRYIVNIGLLKKKLEAKKKRGIPAG